MALRIMLVVVPLAAVAALVLLLNSLDVGAGIAVAALGLVAVAGGAALGYFADRLPEIRKTDSRHSDGAGHLAGAHYSHR
jgi:hypothetical protein